MNFYPYENGGTEKVLAICMLKEGGRKKFRGSF